MLRLTELFPASRFVGMDLSEAMRRRLGNIDFVVRDVSDFDTTAEREAFDVVTTFDAIHDQARPLRVLRGIYRALTPTGVYVMQDINGTSDLRQDIEHPLGTLLYTISCLHCMTVSLAQGGEGLGAMWGSATARRALQDAGFRSIEVHRLAHDIMNDWYVSRK